MAASGRFLPVPAIVGFFNLQPAMLAERPGSAKSGQSACGNLRVFEFFIW
jgi:hypothetical protein